MKKLLILLFIVHVINFAQDKDHNPEITAKEIKSHLEFLASDKMKGRFSGSPEERMAGEYIKEQFKSYGLKPAFNGSWFQEFPFIEKVEMTKINSVKIISDNKKQVLKPSIDFTTLGFSGKTKINSELVFVGYGISAPKLNYDDYNGIDVKGKIVIAMKNHPEHDSSKSEFEKFISLRNKANTAKEKGAVGIIFVNGYYPKNDDLLSEPKYDGAPAMKDFAVIQIKREIIESLLKSKNFLLEKIQKQIDINKKPNSFELKNIIVDLSTEVKEVQKTARNVGGILEGTDPVLKNEYIVIGAHYDHLGIDQLKDASMYKGTDKQIHNGADDNASGTTGVLEVAEKFASVKNNLKRSILFLAFSGEELGILGSTYFTNNSPIEINKIVAMLNMDMVGRLNNENNLTIIGSGTSSKWKEILNNKNKYDFKLSMSDGGSGGSDHQAFSNKNIPVLFFFTGTHNDYHKPSDDVDKINFTGEEKVLNFVFDIGNEIQQLPEKPDYVKVVEQAQRPTGRARVTVGTVPEFGYNGNGYKLSGTTEGGPAAKAGLKSGDIIIKFGPKSVGNIYDFMYAVQDYKAGDKVDVIVLRDGKEMTFTLELIAK
ncbi:M28 family peptidase [Stygiobacter electus]|uniref:M28 family peptidase n=1 Tax=Stygiobacter electus TaxID=3032292 RepID=A0AAE3NYI7_9BACT|nr:M28 family peptidase [Stygiobacter electus]MDF1611067.1 M28 family peptidase [Stygiobacter electus]